MGYTDELIKKEDVYLSPRDYQIKLIEDGGDYLSAFISDMNTVFAGQIQPHLQIRLINYPRYSLKKVAVKINFIEIMTKTLMNEFGQLRPA